jgi:hypothetical protein
MTAPDQRRVNADRGQAEQDDGGPGGPPETVAEPFPLPVPVLHRVGPLPEIGRHVVSHSSATLATRAVDLAPHAPRAKVALAVLIARAVQHRVIAF